MVSGLLRVIACSRGTSWSIAASVSCRKTRPVLSIVMVKGSTRSLMLAAGVFGRSTGTPTVSRGAATMKTTRSTSMTSTIGVTLISDIGL